MTLKNDVMSSHLSCPHDHPRSMHSRESKIKFDKWWMLWVITFDLCYLASPPIIFNGESSVYSCILTSMHGLDVQFDISNIE